MGSGVTGTPHFVRCELLDSGPGARYDMLDAGRFWLLCAVVEGVGGVVFCTHNMLPLDHGAGTVVE
jgi:hypothetical protein